MENSLLNPEDTHESAISFLQTLNEVGGWEIYDEKDDIISKRRIDDDGYYIYSSHIIIESKPDLALDIILNEERRKLWFEILLKSSVLKTWGENMKLIYMQLSYPWLLSNREVIILQGVSKTEDDTIYIAWKSIDAPEKPIEKGFVRATVDIGGFAIKSLEENKILVSYTIKINSQGSVPISLSNYLSRHNAQVIAKIKDMINQHYLA